MNRTEALEHFEQNYVQVKTNEKILQAEVYLLQHREQLVAEFRESFRTIFQKVKVMQTDGLLDKVGFINFALLRSALLRKLPLYRIDVYNKEWYFDIGQSEITYKYEVGWLSRFLDELGQELEEPCKRYLNQVTIVDLEQIKLREAVKFNQLLVSLADYALHQDKPINGLAEITKEDEFEVRVGEYFDISEVVYKEDLRSKDAEEIKEWLEDQHENQYVAAILRELNLSGGDYRKLDLRRVDFRGSNLTESNFAGSMLIKARLNTCLLSQTDFTGAAIHDADFSGANLCKSIFFAAEGAKGMANTMADHIYSVWGVNFSGADLTGVDFRYADLRGANFSGAQLAQTQFYGAKLDEAIFDRAVSSELNLDETQSAVTIWVD